MEETSLKERKGGEKGAKGRSEEKENENNEYFIVF